MQGTFSSYSYFHYLTLTIFLHHTYRVKLACDLVTRKEYAIKFLKFSPSMSKYQALELFINEIKILSQCSHPNIAKLVEASLDGTIVTRGGQQMSHSLSLFQDDDEE